MFISVASAAELTRALEAARGGETFLLAPGNYGYLRLDDLDYDQAVTIRSADPSNMAQLSGLEIRESENMQVEQLDVGRASTPEEKNFGKMVSVYDSTGIAFDGMDIHGTRDDNPHDDGYGLYARGSVDISVRHSSFTDLSRGVMFDSSDQIVVEDNNFKTIKSDGANFRAVRGVQIKNNYFRDFYPGEYDHSDAIQFFTRGGARASSDISITGNQVFTGKGVGPQGIFMNDEMGWMPYKNVTIDNNILYGGESYQGIALFGGINVSITNNTVLSPEDDGRNFWIKVARASDVDISNNVTDVILFGDAVSGLHQLNNLVLYRHDDPRESQLSLGNGAQTSVADLVLTGIGYVPTGPSPAPAPAPVPVPTTSIVGTWGNDHLRGTGADERFYGFAVSSLSLGVGSRDVMVGLGGADLFVLGDHRGVFYDDRVSGPGRLDYASIRDFSAGDRIQLSGESSDYVLRNEYFGRDGVGLYLDSNSNRRWDWSDEFVAHISGELVPTSLTADYFSYV